MTRGRPTRTGLPATIAVLLLVATTVSAQPAGVAALASAESPTSRPAPASAPTAIADAVAPGSARSGAEQAAELPQWLAGCWAGVRGDERFHERWTAVDDATLMGLGYTVKRGRLASFEYFRIVMKEGRAVYIAQPSGAPPTEFPASAASGTEVTFENLGHDFPKRVSYRRVDATHLTAWIDGGPASAQRIEFVMQRTSCEPG